MMAGEPVRGHFAIGAAATLQPISLFSNGAARTLQPDEFLMIDFGTLTVSAATVAQLVFDNDGGGGVDVDLGEAIVVAQFASAGAHEFERNGEAAAGSRGIPLSVLVSAGTVGVTFSGRIIKA